MGAEAGFTAGDGGLLQLPLQERHHRIISASMAEHHHRTIPQRFRDGRPWSRCRCPPQTCRLAEGCAVQGSRVKGHAPGPSPLLHGGAPPPDHPPAVWGRATAVQVQVFPQTCRVAEGLAGKGHALGPSPLLHGGAPPPDHPPAVAGRATVVQVQVSSPNVAGWLRARRSRVKGHPPGPSPPAQDWQDGTRGRGNVAGCPRTG